MDPTRETAPGVFDAKPWPFEPGDLMQAVPPHRRPRVGRPAAWFVLWPILIIATAPVAGILTSLIVSVAASTGEASDRYSIFRILHPAIAVSYVALFLIFLKWTRARGVAIPATDPRPARLAEETGYAFLFLVLTFVLGASLLTMVSEWMGNPDPPVDLVPVEAGPSLFWIALPAIVIIGPVVEEMVFRGWMLPALRARGMSWGAAIALSSVVFGLLHGFGGLLPVLYTTLVGISAGVLRMRTGRLYAPMLFHALNNFVVIALPQLAARAAG